MLPAPSRICSGGSKSLSGSETFTVTASHKLLTYFPIILSMTKGTYIKCLRKISLLLYDIDIFFVNAFCKKDTIFVWILIHCPLHLFFYAG